MYVDIVRMYVSVVYIDFCQINIFIAKKPFPDVLLWVNVNHFCYHISFFDVSFCARVDLVIYLSIISAYQSDKMICFDEKSEEYCRWGYNSVVFQTTTYILYDILV